MAHKKLCLSLALGASFIALNGGAAIANDTTTPIKHVIVLIGENRTFDNVYATYKAKSGESVENLLSKGIVKEDGSPGPNFTLSQQFQVNTPLPSGFFISSANKTLYSTLPVPDYGGAPNKGASFAAINADPTSGHAPFDNTVSQQILTDNEPSLEVFDLDLLRTGATGGAKTSGPDLRITNGDKLPDGSFQITGLTLPYDSYSGDMVHRLFHMWQQSDCDVKNATAANPSGCLNDLVPFVGLARGDNSSGNGMGFYNVLEGDAPIFASLAAQFTLADNYHQPAMGGTLIQHIYLGSADNIFWTDGKGTATTPPAGIADPTPVTTTSAKFKVDGTYTNCSDTSQPGIAPIVSYLATLPYKPDPKCEAGHFYVINNVSPGFLPNGQIDTASIAKGTKIPPSPLRTIGDALNDKGISWAYYGGGYDAAVRVANGNPIDAFDKLVAFNYCDICNFESYTTSIMGDATQRATHIKDAIDFFDAVEDKTLPAVSFVKPDSFLDGHPASSKLDLLEGMIEKIIDRLKAKHMFHDTALIITFDEGGGYYDDGYMQPLDFFGDGPRIPTLVISDFSTGGKVVHTYYDHASVLKFIEKNWSLSPLTKRSRDNLPNPKVDPANPYVPTNAPAVGDLFDMFDFSKR
jgi:phospholipase C